MIKYIHTIFILLFISCNNYQNLYNISSPDNKIKLEFSIKNGVPLYKIVKNNNLIIDYSKLGIVLDGNENLDRNFKIINTNIKSHNSTWNTIFGEEKEIINNYNELLVELDQNNKKLKITFRVFNDGVGFRYEIENQESINNYNILDEKTEFKLSKKDTAWWIPAFSYRRYEFLYAKTAIDDISKNTYSKMVEDIRYDSIGIDAAHTPLTIKKENGILISIHEANLNDYSSMTLAPRGKGLIEAELYPWSDGIKVKANEKIISPWRTIQISNNSSDLLNSNLILNLNEDPDSLEDFSWVKPGKYMGIWWEMIGTNESTWWPSKNHGANTKKVLEYIDFASKNGFDGLLVEGWNKGWHPEWCCRGEGKKFSFTETQPDFDIDKIYKYGKERNVFLVGHHETGGQIENYEAQLENAFKFYNKYGIKNIKTGYVNDVSKNIKRKNKDGKIVKEWHHGQYMIRHFRKVIQLAAKYKLNIITHEPIKDTGIRRKYPNYISREGAKGQEFNGFSSNGVNHATVLPFTRLLSGPMDYTPGVFKLNNFRYVSPGSNVIDENAIIPSTLAKELALYVVYYSPMQMAADLPKHYQSHYDAFEFIKQVPVIWEKKKIINSKIGEYVTIARKDINSEDWYLGSITNENKRNFTISLDFLKENRNYLATIYSDTKNTNWKNNQMEYHIKSIEVNKNSKLDIFLAAGGGTAIQFKEIIN